MSRRAILLFSMIFFASLSPLSSLTIDDGIVVLDGNSVKEPDVAAEGIIAGDGYTVMADEDIHFISNSTISLNPGFTVEENAEFSASIGELQGVTVTETSDWEGHRYIGGDLVVGTEGGAVILDIKDDSELIFLDGGTLRILGGSELIASHTVFSSYDGNPDDWKGIDVTGTLTLDSCTISNAERAVLAGVGSTVLLTRCDFLDNRIALHTFDYRYETSYAVSPLVADSNFIGSLWYAVKEDATETTTGGADLYGNGFSENGADYYDIPGSLPDMTGINRIGRNIGNFTGTIPR